MIKAYVEIDHLPRFQPKRRHPESERTEDVRLAPYMLSFEGAQARCEEDLSYATKETLDAHNRYLNKCLGYAASGDITNGEFGSVNGKRDLMIDDPIRIALDRRPELSELDRLK